MQVEPVYDLYLDQCVVVRLATAWTVPSVSRAVEFPEQV